MENVSVDSVALASIGLASTAVVGIIWLAKYFAKKLSADLIAHTAAAIDQSKSNQYVAQAITRQSAIMERNTEVLERTANATVASDKYLRERNGRDNEFQKENIKAIQAIPAVMQKIANEQRDAIIDAVKVKDQYVETSHVKTEIVEKRETVDV